MEKEGQQERQRRSKCETVTNAMRQGYTVEIRCKKCGHRRVVEAAPLWRMTRVRMWPDNFIELGKHVRCGRCKVKWPELRASSEPVDGQAVVGIKTEAEALEAARRLRS